MIQDGLLWELIMSVLPIEERDCGYWHTPNATDGLQGSIDAKELLVGNTVRKIDNSGISRSLGLARQVDLWPTPRYGNPGSRKPGTGGKVLAEEAKKMWITPHGEEKSPGPNGGHLTSQVKKIWATPNVMDVLPPRIGESLEKNLYRGDHNNPNRRRRNRSGNLREQVQNDGNPILKIFPTPKERDWKSPEGSSGMNRHTPDLNVLVKNWPTPSSTPRGPHSGREVTDGGQTVSHNTGVAWGMTLETAVKKWPTPKSPRGDCPSERNRHTPDLEAQVKMYPTPSACSGHATGRMDEWGGSGNSMRGDSEASGQLNPYWVEWLMGWPIGWTALEDMVDFVWLSWDVDPADQEKPTCIKETHSIPTPTASDYINRKSTSKEKLNFETNKTVSLDRWVDNVPAMLGKKEIGLIPRVAKNIKDRVNRLKALGNGQVPLVIAEAWKILKAGVTKDADISAWFK
jgi:hypothetical protein